MKGKKVYFLLWVAGTILLSVGRVRAQGSLTPPGAPAPTFKTLLQLDTKLDQISNYVNQASNHLSLQISQAEPRIPIPGALPSSGSAQFFISAPGSYYLTTNMYITNASLDAISVLTNDLTIDLNGFSIVTTNLGVSGPSPVGIRINGSTNVTVRNGQIFGFDRAIRAQNAFHGVVVDNIHAVGCSRAGIELNGVAGDATQTATIRQCVVENINSISEGTASADGIVVLNCEAVVDSCVVRDIFAAASVITTCITFGSATNSFANNNFLAHSAIGLNITGGGTRVYYRNNLTAGCGTPFSSSGGVDRGGNF